MNKRIKELAEQATTPVDGYRTERILYEARLRLRHKLDEEKFAELIVKECAKIAELKEQGSNEYDPNVSVGWYIRQHFGVEE